MKEDYITRVYAAILALILFFLLGSFAKLYAGDFIFKSGIASAAIGLISYEIIYFSLKNFLKKM